MSAPGRSGYDGADIDALCDHGSETWYLTAETQRETERTCLRLTLLDYPAIRQSSSESETVSLVLCPPLV